MDIADQVARLDTSPILDHTVRESLRLGPPVHGTISRCSNFREFVTDNDLCKGVATRNDRIPLSQPILKRNGKWEDSIPITKGSFVHIPIEALNVSEHVWGPDAQEFK